MKMGKGRLEAFSDGVIAIIITIMVLEMKVPHGDALDDLRPILPIFLSYVLSYIYVGVYWTNHHHMLHAAKRVSGPVLWANLHLLFWLSLLPFGTGWMGENHFTSGPSALYGFILFMAGVSYIILQRAIIALEGESSLLRQAVGRDWKGKCSVMLYVLGMAMTCWSPFLSQMLYVIVAVMWLVPDRRIEGALGSVE